MSWPSLKVGLEERALGRPSPLPRISQQAPEPFCLSVSQVFGLRTVGEGDVMSQAYAYD